MTIRDSLAQVQELLGRATPGPYLVEACEDASRFNLVAFDGPGDPWIVAEVLDGIVDRRGDDPAHGNANAIAAAVNWLREHGPELMKRLEGKDK